MRSVSLTFINNFCTSKFKHRNKLLWIGVSDRPPTYIRPEVSDSQFSLYHEGRRKLSKKNFIKTMIARNLKSIKVRLRVLEVRWIGLVYTRKELWGFKSGMKEWRRELEDAVSENETSCVAAGCGRHGMSPPACKNRTSQACIVGHGSWYRMLHRRTNVEVRTPFRSVDMIHFQYQQ